MLRLTRALSRSFTTQLLTSSTAQPSSLPPKYDPSGSEISDEEWDIRTGRAIYILRETLPDFFSRGLVAKSEGQPSRADDDAESIYGSRIRLEYTPPVPLPSPFPRTLHVEGLPLYMASSVFVRHSMNALYTTPHVEMRKLVVNTPPPLGASGHPASADGGSHDYRTRREKSLFVALSVKGTARVSGVLGQWDVNSTYTFSPATGLIDMHTINSIHPAPHQAVWDTMRSGLGQFLGLQGGSKLAGEGSSVGTMCEENRKCQ